MPSFICATRTDSVPASEHAIHPASERCPFVVDAYQWERGLGTCCSIEGTFVHNVAKNYRVPTIDSALYGALSPELVRAAASEAQEKLVALLADGVSRAQVADLEQCARWFAKAAKAGCGTATCYNVPERH